MKIWVHGLLVLSMSFSGQLHCKILNIGHRGACGYAPENTLVSFQKALDMGVDAIEFDVHLSKDVHLMVIHDAKVDRTTNGFGYVRDKTLDELKQLDAGGLEQIPTLEEALDLIDRKAIVIIEPKTKNTAKPIANLIKHYKQNKGWSYDDFLITNFDHQELLLFMQELPEVNVCAAYRCIPFELAKTAEKYGVYALTITDDLLDENFIKDTHNHGIKVFLAVYDYSLKNIAYLQQLDIDGFYLNYPDKINLFVGDSHEK